MSSLQKLNETSFLKEVRIIKCINKLAGFNLNGIYTANISAVENNKLLYKISDNEKNYRTFDKETFEKYFKDME